MRCSADIDTVRKKITVLSPSAGRLPSKTAIIGVSSASVQLCDHSNPLPTLTFSLLFGLLQSLDWQDV